MATNEFKDQLAKETAGIKLSITAFGCTRAIDDDQTARAAGEFGASPETVSAKKRLLDTRHEAYRAVSKALSGARRYWRSLTIDYPVTGVRLMRRDLLPIFGDGMAEAQAELATALVGLSEAYEGMKASQREKLGELYNEADYPTDITADFKVEWEVVGIDPPNWLQQLNPALYAAEQQRVAARLDAAVANAEAAYAAELKKMVDRLLDKLSGLDDNGKPKVLRGSVVTGLAEFVARLKSIRMTDDAALNEVVGTLDGVLSGVDPEELRNSGAMKADVAEKLSKVQANLDMLVEAKPGRAIDLSDEGESQSDSAEGNGLPSENGTAAEPVAVVAS